LRAAWKTTYRTERAISNAAKTLLEIVMDFDVTGIFRVVETRFHLATVFQAIASTIILAIVADQSCKFASLQVLFDRGLVVTLVEVGVLASPPNTASAGPVSPIVGGHRLGGERALIMVVFRRRGRVPLRKRFDRRQEVYSRLPFGGLSWFVWSRRRLVPAAGIKRVAGLVTRWVLRQVVRASGVNSFLRRMDHFGVVRDWWVMFCSGFGLASERGLVFGLCMLAEWRTEGPFQVVSGRWLVMRLLSSFVVDLPRDSFVGQCKDASRQAQCQEELGSTHLERDASPRR
jgi:hypothetical protein